MRAAAEAGADWITLCDTNGGSLPSYVTAGRRRRCKATVPTRLGIHTHNDSDLAVANALAAVEAGCVQVQGTINGWGERCGNANLISIIPALQLKMDRRCVPDENLATLTELSRTVSEIANIRPRAHAPYVGASAFAHKGGVHVAAVEKVTASYEHIPPERVGNRRHIVVSRAVRARQRAPARQRAGRRRPGQRAAGGRHASRSSRASGYQFEAAEGSFELLVAARAAELRRAVRGASTWSCSPSSRRGNEMFAEATVKLHSRRRDRSHRRRGHRAGARARRSRSTRRWTRCTRWCARFTWPTTRSASSTPRRRTGAKTRVLIESARGEERWSTIGVSQNIIEASCQALADAFELPLVRASSTAELAGVAARRRQQSSAPS